MENRAKLLDLKKLLGFEGLLMEIVTSMSEEEAGATFKHIVKHYGIDEKDL